MNYHLYLIIALGLLVAYLAAGWLRSALRCAKAQRDYRRELGKNLLLIERQDRLARERTVGMSPAHSAPYTDSPSPAPAPDYLAPAMIWSAASGSSSGGSSD